MGRTLARIALILAAGATVYVASTPGFPSTHAMAWSFFHEHLGLSAGAAETGVNVARKALHVPAYALLAALVWWALPPARQRVGIALGVVMAIAACDELVQSLQPARTGRALDLLVDLAGATLGLWIAGAFRRREARS